MNYGKYDTISFKRCFYLLICNELFCTDQGNQLLIITNTINIITIMQPSHFNVVFMVTFYIKEHNFLIFHFQLSGYHSVLMSRDLMEHT